MGWFKSTISVGDDVVNLGNDLAPQGTVTDLWSNEITERKFADVKTSKGTSSVPVDNLVNVDDIEVNELGSVTGYKKK